MVFDVIGSEGMTSLLQITGVLANRAADSSFMEISVRDGLFTVVSDGDNAGDYDGDGKWTALDALVALQMSVGKRPEDLHMDVTGDNRVTSLDAREILKQAVSQADTDQTVEVTIIPVRPLSEDQQRLVDMFGWPHSFTLLEIEDEEGRAYCSESWTYYDGQTRYYFIDGDYHNWEPVDPVPDGSIATPYRPHEFILGSSPEDVSRVVAPGDEWIAAGEAAYLFEGILDGAELFAAPQLIAGFFEGRLIFLESVALVPDEGDEAP